MQEYNNQTILKLNDTRPITDKDAVLRGNSLRHLLSKPDVNSLFDCKNICINNKDCIKYNYINENSLCNLYRRDPFKNIKDINQETCIKYCSKDNDCDYAWHTKNNECFLFSRENNNISSIGDLIVDYGIYGLNKSDGIKSDNFKNCLKDLKTDHLVYSNIDKQCIPKQFYTQSNGDTTIYFDKEPVNKYSFFQKYFGLNSKYKEDIIKIKKYFVYGFVIFIFAILFAITIELK